jgi:hypothetical protein
MGHPLKARSGSGKEKDVGDKRGTAGWSVTPALWRRTEP